MVDFIGKYEVNNSICDKLVEYYHNTFHKKPGLTGSPPHIDKNVKDSIDVHLHEGKLFESYFIEMNENIKKYFKEFVFSQFSLSISEPATIQFYPKGGGYKKYHFERGRDPKNKSSMRHLVYMTYLNDVKYGGQTEFLYQKKKFDARKGKTLIWPSEWTHTHRGIVAPYEEKIIITGWYSLDVSELRKKEFSYS